MGGAQCIGCRGQDEGVLTFTKGRVRFVCRGNVGSDLCVGLGMGMAVGG